MTDDSPAEVPAEPSRSSGRSPLLGKAVACMLGVAVDHWLDSTSSLPFTLSLGLFGLVAWGVLRKRMAFLAVAGLLLACAAVAAAWHHLHWTSVRTDHLAVSASEAPAPIRVLARVVDTPVIIPPRDDGLAGGAPQIDRTLCHIECRAVCTDGRFEPASGRVRLDVWGHLVDIDAGDEVEVIGRVMRPQGPQNPGGFDFQAYLRQQGVHVVIRCQEPEGVIRRSSRFSLRQLSGQVRSAAEQMLSRQLSDETAPLGIAMLLGTRTGLSEEVRDAFRKSGTMHILAISGMHVAILAALVLTVCRMLNLGRRTTLGLVLLIIVSYAALTDLQPPVMRSVIMIAILVAGRFHFRQIALRHSLSLAGLGVLAWNPAHLFDAGAQLSFLAVAGLSAAPGWNRMPLPPDPEGPLSDLSRQALDAVRRGIATTAAVWIFTLPLTASVFHLVSPVGFLVNVLLAPLSVVVLWCGYLTLLIGLLAPPLATPFGIGFDLGLRGLLALVDGAARLPLGHFSVSGPPLWWLAGFYGLLAALCLPAWRRLTVTRGLQILTAWSLAGLTAGLVPGSQAGLSATFLSVGHGVAVLVELPGGRCLLYDAGQLQDPRRAAQAVESVLWNRGRTAVDVLVLSHADVDHFNAAPTLAEQGTVRSVLFHPSFLDFSQEPVATTCERCAASGVPLRFIWAGDRVALDSQATIEVLQPESHATYSSDNANSLVLRVTYAGRALLLTGDLEGSGLASLLAHPRQPVDVLLAPHHGSRASNPPELAGWASPSLIVASSGQDGVEQRLAPTYGPDACVWSTRDRGAVTVRISPAGDLDYSAFRAPTDESADHHSHPGGLSPRPFPAAGLPPGSVLRHPALRPE